MQGIKECDMGEVVKLSGPEDVVDFAEFRPLLEELLEEIKVSIKGTGEKPGRGDWSGYSEAGIFDAVAGEFDEFREAFVRGDMVGEHGQIAELWDVAVTALKGVRRLRQISAGEVL
jgi:hypothetical protein